MMEKRDIVLVTNSPGELSAWVKVVAQKLKEKARDTVRVVVFFVPCPSATGKEKEIASKYRGIDLVFSPADFLKYVFWGILPKGYVPAKRGLVVFLGGDFWHAAILSWRTKYAAVAYVARDYLKWESAFEHFFVPDERIESSLIRMGIDRDRISVVGHLLVEGVKPFMSKEEAIKRWGIREGVPVLGMFPGSRLYNLQDSLPVFLKVAEEVKEKMGDVQFLVGISPFRTLEEVSEAVSSPKTPVEGRKGVLKKDGEDIFIETEGGILVKVFHKNPYDMINLSDLVLTIPGTNTAECAYLGKPVVVISSWRARVPPIGLGPLFNILPPIPLRKQIYFQFVNKLRFIALPNLIAGRKIVPEINVEESSSEITEVVVNLLKDSKLRKAMGDELKRIMGEGGASDKISNYILEFGR